VLSKDEMLMQGYSSRLSSSLLLPPAVVPAQFHAVEEASKRLDAAGFVRLSERDSWHPEIKAGGKYYFTRNLSTIVAFAGGTQLQLPATASRAAKQGPVFGGLHH